MVAVDDTGDAVESIGVDPERSVGAGLEIDAYVAAARNEFAVDSVVGSVAASESVMIAGERH